MDTNKLNAIVDGNWTNFNSMFRHEVFSREELEYMLNREINDGAKRKAIALALHQRLCTLRNQEERIQIFKVCETEI